MGMGADVRKMFSDTSKKISDRANDRIKMVAHDFDPNSKLMQYFKSRDFNSFLRNWRPFKPDAGAWQGLRIQYRSAEQKRLDTDLIQRQLTNEVKEATRDVIRSDPHSFLQPLLTDYFHSDDPYLKEEGRQQVLRTRNKKSKVAQNVTAQPQQDKLF